MDIDDLREPMQQITNEFKKLMQMEETNEKVIALYQ